ncbi:hypothetical protein [Streptomyces sp. NPDC056061]|uniref:hypothetical protein n=1 Tax=Streptomyces sp. NPDC056061 TaxID=3345700 RepID=UPI0035E01E52
MTVRSRYRFAVHGIGTAPRVRLLMTARCLAPDCDWALVPTDDEDAGNIACMTHTGLHSGHDEFRREWSDVALVRRLENDVSAQVPRRYCWAECPDYDAHCVLPPGHDGDHSDPHGKSRDLPVLTWPQAPAHLRAVGAVGDKTQGGELAAAVRGVVDSAAVVMAGEVAAARYPDARERYAAMAAEPTALRVSRLCAVAVRTCVAEAHRGCRLPGCECPCH